MEISDEILSELCIFLLFYTNILYTSLSLFSPSHFFATLSHFGFFVPHPSIPLGCIHCMFVAWLCICPVLINIFPSNALDWTVSSPPLSLARSSQPYFLHSALPPTHADPHSSQLLADRWSSDKQASEQWGPAAAVSTCIHRDESSSLVGSGFTDSLADCGAHSPQYYRDIFCENTQSAYKYVSDSKTNAGDFESRYNFDSLYCSDLEERGDANTSLVETPGVQSCTTPYKNIDVMRSYLHSIGAVDSLYSERRSHEDDSHVKARMSKELPPLPTFYLYHPKNCPLHRGAPPRLSPIGALSPPQRSGAPPLSRLNSPLFPRSRTLPALAAPLYYPNLYPPIPPRAPPLPPKLYQGPLQPHVASKILSLTLHFTFYLFFFSLLDMYLSIWSSCSLFSAFEGVFQIWK